MEPPIAPRPAREHAASPTMLTSLGTFANDLWSSLRPVDALDVLLVAAFVYALLSWLRQSRSRFVMLGVVALVAVYAVARWLDLALTLVLFQAGLTVALLALVIIFQEEIRRAFERLGSPHALRTTRADKPSTLWVDDVVTSAMRLARSKTGALMVFPGCDPLDRHLQGGTQLDGKVSLPLLMSIFDTSSPGHDGALIVDAGWVRRFGVHLPLSTRIAGDEPFGTRHTAALGLSERCDALVLVVSEERGEVSLAKDGRLEKIAAASELRTRLSSFLDHITPAHTSSAALRWVRRLPARVLSVVVAAVIWVLAVGPQGESVGRTHRVPVVLLHAPASFMLDQPRPSDVLVTLAATERGFRRLDPASLTVTVNAADIRPGSQQVRLGQQDLELPRGITLHRIAPDTITIVAHETITKSFPVRVLTEGKLPATWKQVHLRSEPEQVKLVVRKSDVGTFVRVETEPVDLGAVKGASVLTRELSIPPGTRLDDGEPAAVRVVIEVTPAQ